jgi:hypothetical protein
MATGELPFTGRDPLSLMIAITSDLPRPPVEVNPALPPALNELILHLLTKDRAGRPATAQSVVDALARIKPQASPTPTIRTAPSEPKPRADGLQETKLDLPPAPRRGKSWLTAGLFVVVFLLALAGGWRFLAPAGFDRPAEPGRSDPPAPEQTARPIEKARSSLDTLRRADIPAKLLAAAGRGDPQKAPTAIVAIWEGASEGTAVSALAFSPDGTLLACGTRAGRLRLLRVPGGEKLHLITAHERMVRQVAFHPDGTVLATSSNDGRVRVWSVPALKQLANFPSADGDTRSLAFSPDGTLLATGMGGNQGGMLHLHRVEANGSAPPVMRDGKFSISALAFGSTGLLAAGDTTRKSVRIWNAATGEPLRTVSPAPGKAPSSLAFTADGKLLAGTFSGTNAVRVWNAATGEQVRLLEGKPKTHKLQGRQHVAIAPDGKQLAAVTGPRAIRLWDLTTGKPEAVIRLNPGVQFIDQVAYSPDGRHLATANSNGTVYILRLAAPAQIR